MSRPDGTVVGLAAEGVFLGAFGWALLAAVAHTDSDLIAIGAGAVVGLATLLARPGRPRSAVAVAVCAVASCALGGFLARVVLYRHDAGVTLGRAGITGLRHLGVFYFQTLGATSILCWAGGAAIAFLLTYARIPRR